MGLLTPLETLDLLPLVKATVTVLLAMGPWLTVRVHSFGVEVRARGGRG